MRITCDPAKRLHTLDSRGLDMRRAGEVFAGLHLTRPDDRIDYGEPRFITAGWLDAKFVVLVWTPRGSARRIISMRHCHEREAQKLRPHLTEP
jgi:uncharacterized DUF497 family protein